MERKRTLLQLLYILIGCGMLFIPKAESGEPETVKVYDQRAISWAPIVIAEEENFFKDQGININFIKADISESLNMLLDGRLDVAVLNPASGLYNIMAENKSVKFVANTVKYAPGNGFQGIVIRRNSDAVTDESALVKSLKGKKVAIPNLGSMPDYFIEKFLERNGVSVKDVKLVAMPFNSIMAAVDKGDVEAGFLVEPFVTILKANKKISFISLSDKFPDVQSIFLIYGSELLGKKKDIGIKFMIAYLKGCKQYNQGKTKRNIEILKKYLGLDEDLLTRMEWPVISSGGDIKILNDYQEWLLEKKYINKKISAQIMIENSFLSEADKALKASK